MSSLQHTSLIIISSNIHHSSTSFTQTEASTFLCNFPTNPWKLKQKEQKKPMNSTCNGCCHYRLHHHRRRHHHRHRHIWRRRLLWRQLLLPLKSTFRPLFQSVFLLLLLLPCSLSLSFFLFPFCAIRFAL